MPLHLVNNGHTIVQIYPPGSGNTLTVDGEQYELQQIHFHHPGEEAVNSKLTDMDIHLVHQSADGKLAVLAVRLSEDIAAPNAIVAALWPHLPAEAGKTLKLTIDAPLQDEVEQVLRVGVVGLVVVGVVDADAGDAGQRCRADGAGLSGGRDGHGPGSGPEGQQG